MNKARTDDGGASPLFAACYRGHAGRSCRIVNATPLSIANHKGHAEIAKLLLTHGDIDANTAMHDDKRLVGSLMQITITVLGTLLIIAMVYFVYRYCCRKKKKMNRKHNVPKTKSKVSTPASASAEVKPLTRNQHKKMRMRQNKMEREKIKEQDKKEQFAKEAVDTAIANRARAAVDQNIAYEYSGFRDRLYDSESTIDCSSDSDDDVMDAGLPPAEVAAAEEEERQKKEAAEFKAAILHTKVKQQMACNAHQECLCVVCLANPRTVVFKPCTHLVMCTDCSEDTEGQTCPICRATITERVRFNRLLPTKVLGFCVNCWKEPPTIMCQPCNHLLLCEGCAFTTEGTRNCIKCPAPACRKAVQDFIKTKISKKT